MKWLGVDMSGERAKEIAKFFHETYEKLAPSFGYETRPESAVPWEDVPQQNRALMVAVAGRVMEKFESDRVALSDRVEAAERAVDDADRVAGAAQRQMRVMLDKWDANAQAQFAAEARVEANGAAWRECCKEHGWTIIIDWAEGRDGEGPEGFADGTWQKVACESIRAALSGDSQTDSSGR